VRRLLVCEARDVSGPEQQTVYTHGHQPAVLRSHSWRTAENSAGYVLPHLRPGLRMLDLGCGPGTITIDFAQRIAPGEVLGIDASPTVIETAAENAEAAGCTNVKFATGDAYALDAADATYDVVHAHQVLQHLGDPIAALREARRVLNPGGVLAVRDSDYGAFFWSPPDPLLDRWLQLYHHVTQRNGAQADAGRWLPLWVRQAGFTDIEVTSSTWTFADAETRAWWGGLWAERVRSTALGEQAVEYGFSTEAELEDLGAAFERWAADPDAVFVTPHVEVIARAPA
jgi:ubiquinone/menaquinone biosynthesis C-methylase UbiE